MQALNEQKAELLSKVHILKKELGDWRAKLDVQVKTYRNVSGMGMTDSLVCVAAQGPFNQLPPPGATLVPFLLPMRHVFVCSMVLVYELLACRRVAMVAAAASTSYCCCLDLQQTLERGPLLGLLQSLSHAHVV